MKRPVVELPPEAELGPAMRALPSDLWRRFVLVCNQPTATGKVNYAQAAQDAGFETENRGSLAVIGHRLAHDERVQAALLEEAKRTMGAALPVAMATVVSILLNPIAKNAEKLKAAQILFDRGGVPVRTEHEVKVVHTETRSQMIDRIIRLASDMGLDPAKLLGQVGETMPALPAPTIVQHVGQDAPTTSIDLTAVTVEVVDPELEGWLS